MKSKILFILHMPPPIHGASMMGKYLHDSALINNSFECHYINLALAKNLMDIGKGGIRKLVHFMNLLIKIVHTIRKERPTLCYVTPNAKGSAFYKDFIVVMILKSMGQKVIVHYHNKGVAANQNRLLDNFMYRCFFKNLKVILLAEPLYTDIKKYVTKENIHICPNGIPINTAQIPPKEKPTNREFKILFLSNMMREKGVWDLVEACQILKEKKKEIYCDFIGKWSDVSKDEFNLRIKHIGLGKYITAYGAKYGDDKSVFMQSADVFVLPTHNECFPLVLLEAMEYALPCISTNEGGIPTVITEGKTGFMVEKQNPIALAEKIEYLMEHPDVCKEMGEAGRDKFWKYFTLQHFELRMKKILETELLETEKA